MHLVQFLIAYVSLSVVLPFAVLAICFLYRYMRPPAEPVRACRWCGDAMPLSSRTYCSADCEHKFQQVRQDILIHAAGQHVHHHAA